MHNTVFWSTQAAQSFKLGQPSVSSNDQYFCNYNVCGDETVVRQMSWRRNRLCLPKAIWSQAMNSGQSRQNLWVSGNFFVCLIDWTKDKVCLIWGSSYLAIFDTYMVALAIISNAPKTGGEIDCVCQKKFGALHQTLVQGCWNIWGHGDQIHM